MKLPRLLLAFTFSTASLCAESAYRILAAGDVAALTNRFEPGDVVLLPAATWENTTLTFRGKGTREKPITFRAEPGSFVLTGKSHLIIDGEWVVVEGITLKNGGPGGDGILIKGRHNRLTSSVVDGGTYKFFVHLEGIRHRIDHCYFANKTSDDPTLQIEVDAKEPNEHQLDHNHFGYRAPLGRNGGETIRIGYSHQSMSNSRTLVERNLFERCDGEIEIISSKSGENIYRGNTFLECAGMLTLRHGDRNIVDGNSFIGRGKAGSGGVRIIGEDHVVVNNYIEGVQQGAFWITSGVPSSQLNQYFQAKRALIAHNTVVGSAGPYLDLSAGLGGAGRTLEPEAITVANNLFVLGAGGTLLKGEAGEGWTWQGNLVQGATSGTHPGIATTEVRMERGADGLLRPAPRSTPLGAAGRLAKPHPALAQDFDGQPRSAPGDVGCDQVVPGTHRAPLTPADVGPKWLRR